MNRKGIRKNKAAIHIAPTHTIALKKYNHFLYLKGKIGDQSIKFGLDLGAEHNLVGQYKMKKIAPHFTPNKTVYLVSFNGKEKVYAGNLEAVLIHNKVFDFQNVLLIDLKRLHTIKGLDAILGYDFLSKWTIAINYKNRTLCLW